MDGDRWRLISRVFDEARARSDDERRAFLDRACSDDPALRGEVESLLAHDSTAAEGFFATPAAGTWPDQVAQSEPAFGGLGPGIALGSYRIERLLGQGGMGAVFLAYDTDLHRHVALKVLDSRLTDQAARARLLREARAAAGLNHPSICTIYEVGEADGRAFIAMEFVDGLPLSDCLAGALPLEKAVQYGIEAAEALAHAHEHGVVHRDFKAANVMVGASGRLKIVDFGLARRVDASIANASAMSSLMPIGVVAGTPYAMAPEQVRGAATDTRTDIWALGVLLYEMVAGRKPFQAAAVPELYSAILRDPPAPLPPPVPVALRLLIERSLAKEPAERYQQATEVRAELEEILLDPAVPRAAPASGRHSTRSDTREAAVAYRVARWRRAGAVALAVGFLLLTAALVWRAALPRRAGDFAARDWMLVSTFTNQTGESNLEGTIREALVYELEQSPHINLFTDVRAQDVLQRMRLASDTPITEQVGREMCAREGLKALLLGSVARLDDRYVVESRVIEPATGKLLASVRQEATSRVDLLSATRSVARTLRADLGEALSSIQLHSAQLEPVTSASFEAVQQFTLGRQALLQGRSREALQFFLQALERDSTFASAHHYAALTYEGLGEFEQVVHHLERAVALADHIGPRERHRLLGDYYVYVEQYDRAIAHYRTLIDLYPDHVSGLANLGVSYAYDLQYGLAVGTLQRALQMGPDPVIRDQLAEQQFKAGQVDEAVRLAGENLKENPGAVTFRVRLATYELGRGNVAEAERLLAEPGLGTDAAGSNARALARADVLLTQGRFRAAMRELGDPTSAWPGPGPGILDEWQRRFRVAEILLEIGETTRAAGVLRRLPDLAEKPDLWMLKGAAAARAGDLTTARAMLAQLEKAADDRKSRPAQARPYQLQSAIALQQGSPNDAVAFATRAVQTFGSSLALHALAQAQDAAGDPERALQSYKLVLARAGERTLAADGPAAFKVVLAHFAAGRLLERSGQIDAARVEYQDFLRRWADADRDLAPFRDVRRRLGQGVQAMPSGRGPTPVAYSTDSVTPLIPRSASMRESESASEQNGARPSQVATRQNVWQKWPASTRTAR